MTPDDLRRKAVLERRGLLYKQENEAAYEMMRAYTPEQVLMRIKDLPAAVGAMMDGEWLKILLLMQSNTDDMDALLDRYAGKGVPHGNAAHGNVAHDNVPHGNVPHAPEPHKEADTVSDDDCLLGGLDI